MKKFMRKHLESWVQKTREDTELLASSLEDLKAEDRPVHQVTLDNGKMIAALLEGAMRVNASLFEARPDNAERKLRLELDNALRLQLNTIRELLQLPTREGS